jgi:hypothetical protein
MKDITDIQIVMPTSGEEAIPADSAEIIMVNGHSVLKKAS